ncbi:MAG: hypothetical protein EPO26_08930 [Chloroflexota bacterium]|nr:MAG: hypothetical protein EPO26_08930 [Chloroflexota bacterium]
MAARSPAAAPDRFLLAIVVGAILVVVGSIAAVVLARAAPPDTSVNPDSPVGVTRAYIEAIRSGDSLRAREYLSPTARASIEKQPDAVPRYVESPDRRRRIIVEPVEQTSDRATVKVTISTFTARSDPFSSGTWHNEVTVRLIRENDSWRISQPAEPYPFF